MKERGPKDSNLDKFDTNQIIKYLKIIMILTLSACFLYTGAVVFFHLQPSPYLNIVALILVVSLIGLSITKYGKVKLVIHSFMLLEWIILTFINWQYYGGLDSPVIGLYILIIISGGLTLGLNAVFLYSILSLLSIVGLYLGQLFGRLPLSNSYISAEYKLIVYLIIILFASLLVHKAVQSIKNALFLARIHKKNLEARNIELSTIRTELEQRVNIQIEEIFKQKLLFESLFHNGPIAIVNLDANHKIISCNPAFENLFGYAKKEILNQDLDELINNTETLKEAVSYTTKVKGKEQIHTTGKRINKEGEKIDVEIFGIPIVHNNETIGILAIYNDITEQKSMESILRDNEERYRSLFENSPISLWEEDFSTIKCLVDDLKRSGVTNFRQYFTDNPDTVKECISKIKIININQASVDIYKAKSKDELLAGLMKLTNDDSVNAFKEEFINLAEGKTEFSTEISTKNICFENMYISLNLAIAPGFDECWSKVFVTVSDITKRKSEEKRLEYLSSHDSLTGLANRLLFYDRFEHALAIAKRKLQKLAILFIDLDKFKLINDTYGHNYGDLLLKEIAQRLHNTIRNCDTIARIGGDEFTIILENICDKEDAKTVADKINKIFYKPFQILGEEISITCSIGIGLYPEHGDTVESLLKNADETMYLSKQFIKSHSEFFRTNRINN